jgi:hypothetical protein
LRIKLYASLALAALAAFVWSSDTVTLDSERTIYTADCSLGQWAASVCTGKLSAGSRYRYRVLKAHGEVFFWIAGSSTEPSGKFVNCAIQDGRNWICPVANADSAKSITLAMKRGNPVSNPAWPTRPLHAVSKLDWYLLRIGFSLSRSNEPTV